MASTLNLAASPARRAMPGLVVVALVGVLAWWFFAAGNDATYDTWGGALVGAVLVTATLPLVVRLARREGDPVIARIIVISFLLKMAAAVVRYWVFDSLYDGIGDAIGYDLWGESVANQIWAGDFDHQVERDFIGTGFIRIFTGYVYALTGPTMVGGFLAYAWLGWWGLYLFHRAFEVACPEGDRRRYAALVFLLPSLLFWPSSIGKEAWMMLALGIAAYGVARVLTHRRWGLTIALVGVGGTALVRPHVSAVVVLALLAAYLLRRRPHGASILSPLAKLGGIAIIVVGVVIAIGQTSDLLGHEEFSVDSLTSARDEAVERTADAGAGSAFQDDTQTDLNPSQFHLAVLNVLFRPYPWEASNAQSLIAAAEGFTLLLLFVLGWRRLVGAIRSALRTPYVIFVGVYSVLFIYGFSAFSNFGILTRQRVQLLPFVVVLLALPPLRREEQSWRALLGMDGARDGRHEPTPDVVDRPMDDHAASR